MSFDFGLVWIRLLIAKNEIQSAQEMLIQLRQQMKITITICQGTTALARAQYSEIIDVLFFDILLSTIPIRMIIQDVQNDIVLTDSLKIVRLFKKPFVYPR